MSKLMVLISSITLAIGIAGCHGVKPISSKGTLIDDSDTCSETSAAELCKPINLADGYRRGYLRRAGVISGTREAFGYSIIAASALALYYAASPQPMRANATGTMVASPDYAQRVRRLGAFGAGLYAYGQWGSPKARDLVYIDGARAMSCAVLKASPAIPAIEKKSVIEAQLATLNSARRELLLKLDSYTPTGDDAAQVQAILEESSNLADQASQLLVDITSAGPRLRARINLIDVAVRRRLVDESPTFESLVALTASQPGISRSLNSNLTVPLAATPSPAAPLGHSKKTAGKQFAEQNAMNAFIDSMRTLYKEITYLSSILTPLAGVRNAVDSVEECAVGGGANFTIAPSATNATVELQKSYQVVVTDPVGHPSASIAGGQIAAVGLKAIELTGKDHEYRVTVTGLVVTTNATKPILSIRSASGISGADISLTVMPKN